VTERCVLWIVLLTLLAGVGCCSKSPVNDRASGLTSFEFEQIHGELRIDIATLRKHVTGFDLLDELHGVAGQMPVPLYLDVATVLKIREEQPFRSFLPDAGTMRLPMYFSILEGGAYLGLRTTWTRYAVYLTIGERWIGEDPNAPE